MIALATGNPTLTTEGDRTLVAFPSGTDELVISLSLNQLIHLRQRSGAAVNDAFAAPQPEVAEVITLRRKL